MLMKMQRVSHRGGVHATSRLAITTIAITDNSVCKIERKIDLRSFFCTLEGGYVSGFSAVLVCADGMAEWGFH